jgi:HSP20 family protein
MAKQTTEADRTTERLRPITPVLVSEQDRPGAPRSPLVDLYEIPDSLVVEIDLPGVRIEQIQIVVSHNALKIEGSRQSVCDPERGRYLRVERSTTGFHRVIPLPAAIDPHRAAARYERGVLTVTFPKIPDRRQEAIKIPIAVQ